MKKIITILALVFITQNTIAQLDTLELKTSIKSNAEAMLTAFRNNDWKTFAGFTNEKAVETIGGEEAYLNLLNTAMKELFEITTLDTIYAGKVLQVVKTPTGYQCLLESFIQIRTSDIMVSGVSYDLGTSADGKKWKFLRVEDGTRQKVKEFIPDISAEIEIPEGQMEPNITLEQFLKTYELKYSSGSPDELTELAPPPLPPPPPPPPPAKVKKPAKQPVKTVKPKTKPKS